MYVREEWSVKDSYITGKYVKVTVMVLRSDMTTI